MVRLPALDRRLAAHTGPEDREVKANRSPAKPGPPPFLGGTSPARQLTGDTGFAGQLPRQVFFVEGETGSSTWYCRSGSAIENRNGVFADDPTPHRSPRFVLFPVVGPATTDRLLPAGFDRKRCTD